ncbi:MAG: MerR family transcriptional regulator [Bacteroidota bacterium]
MATLKIEDFDKDNLLKELEVDLHDEEFTLKNLVANNITARHLQYWFENGLLPEKKRKEDENHKFSFIDLIWINIVNELRLMGFPIKKIKISKDILLSKKTIPEFFKLNNDREIVDFYYNSYKESFKDKSVFEKIFSTKKNLDSIKSTEISALFFYIILFIKERVNTKMLVFNTGELLIVDENTPSQVESIAEYMENQTYITIPILKLISKFIHDEMNTAFVSKTKILNDNELQILALIRHGDYDSIKVYFKENKPSLLEVTKNVKLDKEARLSEILLNRKYEKLELITKDGNITYAPRTTKIFLK